MPGITATIGHMFVIRWRTIEPGDFGAVVQDVRALRQKVGKPVLYVAIQDDEYREPESSSKTEIKKHFPELMKHIGNDYIVITATGVRAALQRSFLRALLTMGRVSRMSDVDRVVILDSFEEVLRAEAGNLPAPPAEIVAELREKGVLPSAA